MLGVLRGGLVRAGLGGLKGRGKYYPFAGNQVNTLVHGGPGCGQQGFELQEKRIELLAGVEL